MISEAFFIIIVTGALNGAMCYGLYFKIKQDLSEIRGYVLPSENIEGDDSIDEQIELQVVDRLNTPVDNSISVDGEAKVEHEVLLEGGKAAPVTEVVCDYEQTIDENVAGEVKDVLDTIICGTSCKVDDSVDRSLLDKGIEKSDEPSATQEEVKKKSNSSFLGLGSWLWQQDKTLSRNEKGTDNDAQCTSDENP